MAKNRVRNDFRDQGFLLAVAAVAAVVAVVAVAVVVVVVAVAAAVVLNIDGFLITCLGCILHHQFVIFVVLGL